MTTIGTAAAKGARGSVPFAASFVLMTLGALGLSGCASGPNILSAFQPAPPAGDAAAEGVQATAALPKGKVAVAPVIGAPDAVAKQLQGHVIAALEQQSVGVAKEAADKSDYTLPGYIVSAREKASAKVSYIWDVTDAAGKRVNRITGEEIVPSPPGKDPWAALTPKVSQILASKAAQSMAAWLSANGQAAAAGGAGAAAPVRVATASADVPLPAGPGNAAAVGTGGAVLARIPAVTGAPGDGNTALKVALQRELSKNGISLTEAASGDVYRVEGRVSVGPGKDGKQPIQIEWQVKDAAGKRLGTVSQKNEIQQGALDGSWGKTADAAAAAAAQGILKLLPQPRSVN